MIIINTNRSLKSDIFKELYIVSLILNGLASPLAMTIANLWHTACNDDLLVGGEPLVDLVLEVLLGRVLHCAAGVYIFPPLNFSLL